MRIRLGSIGAAGLALVGATFIVTQADCDHEGNRDKGRDRIFISWTNPDGSSEIDHLDLRYCDR